MRWKFSWFDINFKSTPNLDRIFLLKFFFMSAISEINERVDKQITRKFLSIFNDKLFLLLKWFPSGEREKGFFPFLQDKSSKNFAVCRIKRLKKRWLKLFLHSTNVRSLLSIFVCSCHTSPQLYLVLINLFTISLNF